MGGLVLRRVGQGMLVILALSLIAFVGLYAIGDPTAILLDPQSRPEDIARFRAAMGLDQPLWRQYLLFLLHLARGNWGISFVYHENAMDVILERLPATLELAVTAMVLAVVAGVPLGVLAGATAPSRLDRWLMTGSIFGFSLPTFWVGLVLIVLFAVDLGWLPASGRGCHGACAGRRTLHPHW